MNLILLQLVVTNFCFMEGITALSTQSEQLQVKVPCIYAPGLTVGNRSRELECCKEAVKSYTLNWASGKAFLTRFLENLQSWNCPQFEVQCNNRTMAFTRFAELVYARFCNQTELLQKCKGKLSPSGEIANTTNMSSMDEWKQLTTNQAITNLDDHCAQVALYEQTTYNDYVEISEVMIPFCDMAHCGYDINTILKHDLTAWKCMPASCRANIIIAMVVVAMLAVAVTIANLTVLFVLTNHQPLRNSQAHYKLSLAVADLLVGILIFPTCLVSTSKLFMQSPVIGKTTEVQGYNASLAWNYSSVSELKLTTVAVRNVGQSFATNFPKSYMDFVGFITTISLLVSVYTLMLASVDRLWAVAFPFNFHKGNATTFSKYAVTALWFFAVLFGILPFIIPGMRYGLVASILVSFCGRHALILYSVSFIIPLVLVWGTTIATFCISRNHNKIRRKITRRHKNATDEIENRLLKTLSAMVLAFSISLVPAAIVLLIPLFVTNIYFSLPQLLDPTASKFYFSVEYVTIIILLTNSLWNCIIYSLRNREFALVAKRLFSRALLTKFFSDTESHKKRNRAQSCITLTTDTKRPSIPSIFHLSKDSPVLQLKSLSNSPRIDSRETSSSRIPESNVGQNGTEL